MTDIQMVIGILVFLIIGLAVTPVIQTFTDQAAGNVSTIVLNATGHETGARTANASSIMFSLVPLFYVIGLVVGTIGFALYKLKE